MWRGAYESGWKPVIYVVASWRPRSLSGIGLVEGSRTPLPFYQHRVTACRHLPAVATTKLCERGSALALFNILAPHGDLDGLLETRNRRGLGRRGDRRDLFQGGSGRGDAVTRLRQLDREGGRAVLVIRTLIHGVGGQEEPRWAPR